MPRSVIGGGATGDERRAVRTVDAGPPGPRLELRLHDRPSLTSGRTFRLLAAIDGRTLEYLAIELARKLTTDDALER
jgi:hypothetical protein